MPGSETHTAHLACADEPERNTLPHLNKGLRTHEEVGSSAGDEAQGIIARLHVFPEMDVGVVEEVSIGIQIVKGLGGQHHPHILPPIKQPQSAQKEVSPWHLQAMCT